MLYATNSHNNFCASICMPIENVLLLLLFIQDYCWFLVYAGYSGFGVVVVIDIIVRGCFCCGCCCCLGLFLLWLLLFFRVVFVVVVDVVAWGCFFCSC